MKTLRFKTNVNCGGCVASVTPFLNNVQGIQWNVDTTKPEKILTVNGDNVDEQTIIETVQKAGFKATPVE